MEVIIIGRSAEECDIVINDHYVSRVHLQLIKDGKGNFFALDLESASGTYVNNKKIKSETQIFTDDKIKIGNTDLHNWETFFKTSGNNEIISLKPEFETNKKPFKVKTIFLAAIYLIAIFIIFLFIKEEVEKKIQNERKQFYSEEIKKNPDNFFSIKTNYSLKILGGIKDAEIILFNKSMYKITQAQIKVAYITVTGNIFKTDVVEINNVPSGESRKKSIEGSRRGIKADAEILNIYIAELNLKIDFNSF